MLSALPRFFDKAFIIGFFLPSLLFVASLISLFGPPGALWPVGSERPGMIPLEEVFVLVLGVWLLAVLMTALNTGLYRMLEGYVGPFSGSSTLLDDRRTEYRRLEARITALDARRQRGETLTPDQEQELQALWAALKARFPAPHLILPTRFGNTIRAFEDYSNRVNGADSVALWPHLLTVVPEHSRTDLADARAKVDLCVNLCFFAMVVALAALVQAARLAWDLVQTAPLDMAQDGPVLLMLGRWLGAVVTAGLVARLAYGLAIPLARSWGAIVKATFDCYLPALAERLGYRLPTQASARRAFWIAVSQRIVYHREIDPARWPQLDTLASPATRVGKRPGPAGLAPWLRRRNASGVGRGKRP